MRRLLAGSFMLSACGRIDFDVRAATSPDGMSSSCVQVPVPFDAQAVYTSTLFVAPTGDDGNDGSAGAPLATPQAAVVRATPGTEIRIAAGTYGPISVDELLGAATRPIRIMGESGAIIDATSALSAIYLGSPDYVVIENLTLRAAVHGVHVDDSPNLVPGHGLVIRGVHVAQAGNDCLKLHYIDDVQVIDNTLDGCGNGVGIYLLGVGGGVLARNTLVATKSGIRMHSGTKDVLVHANRIVDTTEYSLGFGALFDEVVRAPEVYQASRIRVIANVIANGGNAQIVLNDSQDIELAHDTFVGPVGPLLHVLHSNGALAGGARDLRVHNNVFEFRSGTFDPIIDVVQTGASLQTFAFSRNLWWMTDNAGYAGPQLPPEVTAEAGPLIADPGVSPDGHVTVTSTAVAAGQRDEIDYVDIDGQCYANPPAIGADEP